MVDKTKLISKSAFFTSLCMIVYFFLLRGFHLDEMPALRLFNFLFIIIGANYAIKKNIILTNEAQYRKNFLVGMYSSLLTIIIALIILIIYVSYVQPSFIDILQNSFFFWKHTFSFPLIVFIIFIQGVIVSAISSYIIMQYWKKNMPDFRA